jgi:hypothetical protein
MPHSLENLIDDHRPDFEFYLSEVIETGRLARPTAFSHQVKEHAKELTESMLDSFYTRKSVFEAFDRYVNLARQLGVEVRDLSEDLKQVQAGFRRQRPDEVFSVDLRREAVWLLESNKGVSEIVQRTIDMHDHSRKVYEAQKALERTAAPAPPLPLPRDQKHDRGVDGPELGRSR